MSTIANALDNKLGTPTSGTLTNCTGLPISTGVSGLGTGVAAALAINTGSAGAPVVLNGALGTPSSGTLTSCTGLPVSTGISGLGSGVATALAVNTGSAGAFVLLNDALGTPSSGTLTSCTGLPISTGVSGLGTGIATILGSNFTSTPTASTFAGWDANKNLSANNLNNGFTTTVSSAGAITLTVSSTGIQVITGSTAQNVNLPVATTLVAGQAFLFMSSSTNSVTIKTSGGNTLTTLSGSSNSLVICVNPSGGTGTASWIARTSISNAVNQVNGDSGSATPTSLGVMTISAGQGTLTCGQTVLFSGSSTTLSFKVSDANSNTIIGIGAGKAGMSGSNDTALGAFSMASATSTGGSNVAVGSNSLGNLTTGGGLGNNVAIGPSALVHITTGNYSTAIGSGAGASNTGSDNSNIYISHPGNSGESNFMRLGYPGGGTGGINAGSTFIAGITGSTPTSGNTPQVTLCDNAGNLTVISSSTAGKVLTSNGSATPSFQAPSASQTWLYGTYAASAITVAAGHNVSSVTYVGVGDYTINLTTAFGSANFSTVACDANSILIPQAAPLTSSTVRVQLFTILSANADDSFSAIIIGV